MEETGEWTLFDPADEHAVKATALIHSGQSDALRQLLSEHPNLATARIGRMAYYGCLEARSLLHILAEAPGRRPNPAQTVAVLVAAGTDINAPFIGIDRGTPLHLAVDADDIPTLDALLDHGAGIDADGGSYRPKNQASTPLRNAVAKGKFATARRLVERGARTTLTDVAAVGDLPRVMAYFAPGGELEGVEGDDLVDSLWHACKAGQQAVAEYLVGRGAPINAIHNNDSSAIDVAEEKGHTALSYWLGQHGGYRYR